MKDEKFLNVVKNFAKNFNKRYELSKFNLSEPYDDSILLVVSIGGSQGGDCWGGSSSNYTNNKDVVQSCLESDLRSILYDFESFFVDDIDWVKFVSHLSTHDYEDSSSDSSDPYGNYTDIGLYKVDLFKTMKKVLSEEHFMIFKSFWSNEKNSIIENFEDQKKQKEMEILNEKINSFSKNKDNELKLLKSNLEVHLKTVENLKSLIDNFETVKDKEWKDLNVSLKKLTNDGKQVVKGILKKKIC